jgi:type II protein arginine methyltransferase
MSEGTTTPPAGNDFERAKALSRLLRMARTSGHEAEALRLALQIVDVAAPDSSASLFARSVLSRDVPRWHFQLLHDETRTAAYDVALRRAIQPGTRVLDIGCGSGLLGMLAARAGAERVFGCEANPAVAMLAERIVSANGYGGVMQVLTQHSDTLDAERDLGGKVDVIVSEITGGDGLSQGVLPTLEKAMELLKPGGRMVPARLRIRLALVHDPNAPNRVMSKADGFDFTAFNCLAKPAYKSMRQATTLELQSDAQDIFVFDFPTAWTPPAEAELLLTARGGTANAIAQWVRLELDDETSYEYGPGSTHWSCRTIQITPLQSPLMLHPGAEVRVRGSHDRKQIRFWLG